MFYYLYEWWLTWPEDVRDFFSPLRVFKYITVRAFCGAGTAFLLTLLGAPAVIRLLQKLQLKQYIRKEEAPQLGVLHGKKEGTPTMGGLLIVAAIVVSCLLWAMIPNKYVLLVLATLCYMAAVGALDDWLKVKRKKSTGLIARTKLLFQVLWVLVITVCLLNFPDTRETSLKFMIPFAKKPIVEQMPYFIAFLFFGAVMLGASNAVNLTDGLDGLAIGCSGSVALAYLIMTYVAGHMEFAAYLSVPYVPGSGELAVFCGCMLGACLGFLWFNCYPAQVFMGDTGSLALGGAMGMTAILVKQELVLIVVGGVFVIEALSVIMQVLSFKLRKKRIFAMAPLHHHFELKNWSETQVTVRFWILSIIFALLGVLMLKIR